MATRLPKDVRARFSRLGKKGGKKGGAVRALNLTPEQRSESARNAVTARWWNSSCLVLNLLADRHKRINPDLAHYPMLQSAI